MEIKTLSESVLLVNRDKHVATIVLNRPGAMNSLNLELVSGLGNELESLANEETVRVLIITGNGPAFCAGADLKEVLSTNNLPPGEPDFLDRVCNEVMDVLRNYPKPVIAAINGITLAGGLELAMCCDIVLAAQEAKIGDAHANFGVFPGAGGAAILPRLIPLNVAKYLLFTGKTLTATEMKGYGLVNEVHPRTQLMNAAMTLARDIAEKSPIALRRMKAVANRAADDSRNSALAHEQVMLRKHMRSYDMEEGLKAFSEKRPPHFKGR